MMSEKKLKKCFVHEWKALVFEWWEKINKGIEKKKKIEFVSVKTKLDKKQDLVIRDIS